jgi:hypothetical protein
MSFTPAVVLNRSIGRRCSRPKAGRSSQDNASSWDPKTSIAFATISANFQVRPDCSLFSGFPGVSLER